MERWAELKNLAEDKRKAVHPQLSQCQLSRKDQSVRRDNSRVYGKCVVAGVSAGAPPCFGHKGRKFAETDALIDLFHRPFEALLLLRLRHPVGSHSRPAPMNASST